MYFKIRKIYQYSEIVVVEAETSTQALELANRASGDVQPDDTLYDARVIAKSEEPFDENTL